MTGKTQKRFIILMGHVTYTRQIVAEVPADWSDDDIERLSGRELADLTCCSEWEVALSDVVIEQVDVGDEASDDLEPDITLAGDPPDTCRLLPDRS